MSVAPALEVTFFSSGGGGGDGGGGRGSGDGCRGPWSVVASAVVVVLLAVLFDLRT